MSRVLTIVLVAASVGACSPSTGVSTSAPAETTLPVVTAAQPQGVTPAPLVEGPGSPRFLDASLPLLPNNLGFAPRPVDYVRTVYAFAAAHAEILRYVPCFCGCERLGHRGNDDCFIQRRSATGKVLAWEPHGVICEVCLDVAHEAMQLHNTGASVDQIRAEIDRKWATPGTSHTNTPMPPRRGGN